MNVKNNNIKSDIKLESNLLLDLVPQAIYSIDKNGICTYVNDTFLSVLGYEDKTVFIGKVMHDIIHNKHEDGSDFPKEECHVEHQTIITGETVNGKTSIWKKDGTKIPVEYITKPILDNDVIRGAVVFFKDITEIEEAHFLLKESEERFRNLFEYAPFGYQSLDKDGCFIEVNLKWLELFGYKRDEVIGQWFGNFLTPEAKARFKKRFEIFKKRGQIHSEFPMKAKDGTYIQVGFDGEIGYSREKEFKQTHCLVKDITEVSIAQKRLVDSEKRYRGLVENMPLGMSVQEIEYDEFGEIIDFKIIRCNPSFFDQFEMKEEDVIGKSYFDAFSIDRKYYIELLKKLISMNYRGTLKGYLDVAGKYIQTVFYPMVNQRFVLIYQDVTDKIQREKENTYLSNHDFLTDLLNRRSFVNTFEQINKKENYPLGLMMLDVNGLKIVNDAFGHNTGDQVLKLIAESLLEVFRDTDYVFRLGGDEFGVLLPRVTTDEIELIKDQLKVSLNNKKVETIVASVATGYVVLEHKTDETLDGILKLAENHMYRNKLSEGISVRNNAIKAIFKTLNEKYDVERVHSERVSQLCKKIGIAMNINKDDIKELELCGLFHDIGKISIPDAILNKPGRLTDEEYEIIKTHSELSYQILRAADEYSDLAINALYHHERWDGFGYPKGIKGEEIPLFSRIICVADSYEAMTSVRPYKRRMSKQEAIDELKRCKGTQFDPKIVDVFIDNVLN